MRILILGGTSEAAALASVLAVRPDMTVTTSLAGRTRMPGPLAGEVRIGGFGGVAGLRSFLKARAIDLLVDATHPFATRMSVHAAEACRMEAVARLRLCRPPWSRRTHDRWLEAADADAAASMLPGLARRVLLTIGHRDLGAFAALDDIWFLIRTVEPLNGPRPRRVTWLQARGPFRRDDEIALMRNHRIEALVTKASGGAATYGKIAAARHFGLPVVMITRPQPPAGPLAQTVDAAVAWLERWRASDPDDR